MGNPDDDEQNDADWRVYQLDDGNLVNAVEGSPMAAALEQIERDRHRRTAGGLYRMDWSLGDFADLLWMRLPEARPLMLKLVKEEFEEAIESGRELWRLLPGDLRFKVLWWGLLKPAFDAYPASRGDVERYCRFLGIVLHLEGEDGEYLRELVDDVFEWIVDDDQHRRVIAEVDKDLLAHLDNVTRIEE